MTSMTPIVVTDLRKEYGSLRAVDGVSFEVAAGEVYALLGHNGAGKTTTVEILEGFRGRTSGEVAVLGADPAAGGRDLRDRIGIVLQRSGIEPELAVAEAVDLYGSPYRTRRPTGEVLDLVGLADQAGQRVGSLSGGQVRRLDLALGIVGRPELLFLDEPTTGFDPAARRRAWELIEQLRADGTTVLLTTHYLDEAERLADRVGVMAAGRLVAEGTPADLIERLGDTEVSFLLPDDGGDGLRGVMPDGARVAGRHVSFSTRTPTADVQAITSWAVERGVELEGLSVHRPSLEDVFLGLAGADGEGAES
jgi:ABC-2 type transport system ATP-binding protein